MRSEAVMAVGPDSRRACAACPDESRRAWAVCPASHRAAVPVSRSAALEVEYLQQVWSERKHQQNSQEHSQSIGVFNSDDATTAEATALALAQHRSAQETAQWQCARQLEDTAQEAEDLARAIADSLKDQPSLLEIDLT